VDFLQLHNGPVMERPVLSGRSYTYLGIEDYLRPKGALEGLQRVKRSGKARFIGFIIRGNDYAATQQLVETGAFDLINLSVNLLNPSAAVKPDGLRVEHDFGGMLGYLGAQGVGAAVYSPLAGGYLNDKTVTGGAPHPMARRTSAPGASDPWLQRARAVSFLSRNLNPDSQLEDHGLAEAAIRFVLSLEGVATVLGGFSGKEQLEEVVACSGKGLLSQQNVTRLEAVWRANFGLDA